jgi:hypothetical protein
MRYDLCTDTYVLARPQINIANNWQLSTMTVHKRQNKYNNKIQHENNSNLARVKKTQTKISITGIQNIVPHKEDNVFFEFGFLVLHDPEESIPLHSPGRNLVLADAMARGIAAFHSLECNHDQSLSFNYSVTEKIHNFFVSLIRTPL